VRVTRAVLALIALAASSTACLDTYEPDVGLLQRSNCVNEDSDPDSAVSFRDDIVAKIFMPEPLGCLTCHAPTAPTPIGFEVGGLDLTNHTTMLRGGVHSDNIAIIPGQPCESILLQKVSSGPPFGARMPVGGPPYLSDDSLQLLHDWIAEGAKNN
jgi:hypothetical protein